MIVLDLSILNQKGTPMFNSDLTANRPAAGIVGRIFIAIDSPYGIFRDTGTAWDQISSAGGGATIYTGDGTLTGTRTISSGGFQLVFNPQTTFFSSLTAATGGSSFSVLGSNNLTFAVGFSSSNIGNVYGANGAINSQTFLGNATFAQANLASAMVNVNKITMDSGGHTITMTQSTAPGIRAMTGVQNQIQYTGTHNGTISHAAISQNLGFFRDTGAIRTLTITNAYSLLLNPLDDYGSGFTFTNRWGIYQAGASDKNYFAGNILAGSTTDNGQKLQITGNGAIITGGIDEPGLAQVGLRIVNSDVTKNIFLNLKNINGLGKEYGLVSVNDGSFQINNYTDSVSIFRYDPGTNATTLRINTTLTDSLNFYLGLDFTINALWLSATKSVGNYAICQTSGSTFLNAPTGGSIYFRINNSDKALFTTSGRLLIGTTTENNSAILNLTSTSQGFLPPRMTNAQRTSIGSPAVGLIVYCTDAVEGLYVYKSTGWTFVI